MTGGMLRKLSGPGKTAPEQSKSDVNVQLSPPVNKTCGGWIFGGGSSGRWREANDAVRKWTAHSRCGESITGRACKVIQPAVAV